MNVVTQLMQIIYVVVCYHAKTKRILSWFSVLESTNNVIIQGMGNSFRYLYAKKYQHRTWFDRVIEKIKMVVFCLTGYISL